MNFARYQEIMRLQYAGGSTGVGMLPDNIQSVLTPGMKLISAGGDSLKHLTTWFPGQLQPQMSLKSQRAVPHLDNKSNSSPSHINHHNQPLYLPNPKYK
jgi:hypothetical protein